MCQDPRVRARGSCLYHERVSENGSKKKTIGFIGIFGVVASIVWFALRPRLKSKDASDN